MAKGERFVTRKILALAMLGSLTGLAACSTADPANSIAPAASVELPSLPTGVPAFAGMRPEIIDGDAVYQLSAEQEKKFLAYYNGAANRNKSPSRRLARFLKMSTSAYEYLPDTRTAGEVFRLEGGNCLSLANLTTALARLAGIEVGYQLITDVPIFEKNGDVVVRSVHVRSRLLDPRPGDTTATMITGVYDLFGRSGLIVDYFPSGNGRFIGNIKETEFTAMYFRNIAAEAITSKDYARAYWMIQASLEHAPDHPEGINMLAVVYRRMGEARTAEEIYTYGISVAPANISLLKNYRGLLSLQGRTEEAEKISLRLAEIKDSDPFEWWFMAEDAYDQANYRDALTYYRKTVAIAPYLHEGYFGLAKTHYQLGNVGSARKAMQRAVDNANRMRTRTLYEAKLTAMLAQE